MWPSNSIKRSPLKIIRCYSQLHWHKSTEMLNLASVVPAHRGCLFCARALAYSIRLRFPLRLRLPYALIMKLRCKTESQQSKQNKPSAVFVFAIKQPAGLTFLEKICCLQGIKKQEHYSTHMFLYLN